MHSTHPAQLQRTYISQAYMDMSYAVLASSHENEHLGTVNEVHLQNRMHRQYIGVLSSWSYEIPTAQILYLLKMVLAP